MEFAGIKVVESKLLSRSVPKLRLSDELMVTDKFRAEFNQWLVQVFGLTKTAVFMGDTVYMDPESVALLRQQLDTSTGMWYNSGI